MDEKPLHERIAVLETKVEDHTEKLDKFFEKLDMHIVEESENDAKLQLGMEHLSNALNETNHTLRDLNTIVSRVNIKQVQIDTIWTTLAKIGSIAVIVVGGLWAVWSFVIEHKITIEDRPEIVQKK